MNVIDLLPQERDFSAARPDRYVSPADLILEDSLAQKTFADFMWKYVGHPDGDVRRRGLERPHIPVEGQNGTEWNTDQEMFTGYGGLGDLVHIRVSPALGHTPDGYFIAMGNLETGVLFEPRVIEINQSYDSQTGPQTILYLDTVDIQDLPPEYAPRIHLAQHAQRFTYIPGPDRASSLLHPIESLYEHVTVDMGRQLGQRAFTLITNNR